MVEKMDTASSATASHPWTDAITNETLCGFFYAFYVVYGVLAALAILALVVMFFSASKLSTGQLLMNSVGVMLNAGISLTFALFLYLICDRALKPALSEKRRKAPSSSPLSSFDPLSSYM